MFGVIVFLSLFLIIVFVVYPVLILSRVSNKDDIDFQIGLRDLKAITEVNLKGINSFDIGIIAYYVDNKNYVMSLSLPAFLWWSFFHTLKFDKNKSKKEEALSKILGRKDDET